MDAENISRSSNTYIGKLRSNFLGTKFIIYDTQPPHSAPNIPPPGRSKRFYTKKVSPKVPCGSYDIAHISDACNGRGCMMHCVMHAIPASALEPGGSVPGQPEFLLPPRSLEDSFRSMSYSRSLDHSNEFSSSRFSDIMGATNVPDSEKSKMSLVLKNKSLSGFLNYKGRVVTTSVKSFQLVVSSSQPPARLDKVILEFRKVGKDVFTMDYQYPLSAFQAFAICLSSFGTKLGCE